MYFNCEKYAFHYKMQSMQRILCSESVYSSIRVIQFEEKRGILLLWSDRNGPFEYLHTLHWTKFDRKKICQFPKWSMLNKRVIFYSKLLYSFVLLFAIPNGGKLKIEQLKKKKTTNFAYSTSRQKRCLVKTCAWSAQSSYRIHYVYILAICFGSHQIPLWFWMNNEIFLVCCSIFFLI